MMNTNDPAYAHNPDLNKDWKPKFARRIYKCDGCGHERVTETNHTGSVWASECHGNCKIILFPRSYRERVMRAHTVQRYVRELDKEIT